MGRWLVFVVGCASATPLTSQHTQVPARSGHSARIASARISSGGAHTLDIVVEGWLAEVRCDVLVKRELAENVAAMRVVRPCSPEALPSVVSLAPYRLVTSEKHDFLAPDGQYAIHRVLSFDSHWACEQKRTELVHDEMQRLLSDELERVRVVKQRIATIDDLRVMCERTRERLRENLQGCSLVFESERQRLVRELAPRSLTPDSYSVRCLINVSPSTVSPSHGVLNEPAQRPL